MSFLENELAKREQILNGQEELIERINAKTAELQDLQNQVITDEIRSTLVDEIEEINALLGKHFAQATEYTQESVTSNETYE